MDEVEEFIRRRFPDDCRWLTGNCYYFAVILKDRFPEGEIYYDVIDGHFLFKLGIGFYDYEGHAYYDAYPTNKDFVPWDKFDEYDPIQKEVIVRDCIM